MDLKKLGMRIKELRRKKKMTQEILSARSDLNTKHLSEVERGSINISIQKLDLLAQSLEISLPTLLDVEHQKSKEALINELVAILEKSEYKQVQTIYRIVRDIVY
jgi:transcriptional regulator with XRE-family HTH domain